MANTTKLDQSWVYFALIAFLILQLILFQSQTIRYFMALLSGGPEQQLWWNSARLSLKTHSVLSIATIAISLCVLFSLFAHSLGAWKIALILLIFVVISETLPFFGTQSGREVAGAIGGLFGAVFQQVIILFGILKISPQFDHL
jgi:hypothetical protein